MSNEKHLIIEKLFDYSQIYISKDAYEDIINWGVETEKEEKLEETNVNIVPVHKVE